MLYVTTRNNQDAYTSNRALCENRGPDGGMYVPFKMPAFSPAEIDALGEKAFGQRVADILNLLFGTRLTGWDVDFCIGRSATRLIPMSHRIAIGETFHNPQLDFSWTVKSVFDHIRGTDGGKEIPSEWTILAVRAAVLFGMVGELMKTGDASRADPVDVALVGGNFSAPMAAWYAKQWGLPIANIVVCCNENNTPWDLVHRGQIRTDRVAVRTATPNADQTLPACLERLVFALGGQGETARYLETCRRGGLYILPDLAASKLRENMYVSVVSERRMASTIPNVYNTNGRIFGPYTAMSYSGLMDYRAATGENRTALVLAEKGPERDLDTVARAMSLEKDRLNALLRKT